jgi:hypothetical protein
VHGLVTVRHFQACRTGCVARRMVRSLLNNHPENARQPSGQLGEKPNDSASGFGAVFDVPDYSSG